MKQETGYLKAQDGARIFYRSLVPEKALSGLIILHAYAEHSGRYEEVMKFLSIRGRAVFIPDHRGHGREAKILGDIQKLDLVIEDIRALHQEALRRVPGVPFFILGQSMGGMLGLLYARRFQEELKGMVLCGALAKLPDYVSPFLVKISGIVSKLFPLLPLQEFDYTKLSRDPAVIRGLEEDPLYYKGKIRARTGFELLNGIRKAIDGLGDLKLPVLILHGGEDVNVEPEASEVIFEKISSSDKTKKIFAGLRHEIMNEPEKQEVLKVIGDWIQKRIH